MFASFKHSTWLTCTVLGLGLALDLSWTPLVALTTALHVLQVWCLLTQLQRWDMSQKMDGKWHSVRMKYLRCSSTYVSYLLFLGVLWHFMTTLSTRRPSSLKDESPRFERVDRSGPLVGDHSSSIRLLRLTFTLLYPCSIFFYLWWQQYTVSPPSVLHS